MAKKLFENVAKLKFGGNKCDTSEMFRRKSEQQDKLGECLVSFSSESFTEHVSLTYRSVEINMSETVSLPLTKPAK